MIQKLEIRSVDRGICPTATSTINERTVPVASMLDISRRWPVVEYVDSDLTMLRNNDCTRVDPTPAINKLVLSLSHACGQKLGRCLRHKTFQSLW